MKALMGFGLLTSAFAPLLAILAILKIPILGWVSWVIIFGCAMSLLLLRLAIWGVSEIQPRPLEATQVRKADESVLSFTSSYVVPVVVALFGNDVASLFATLALVALLIVIYVRAGLYHLNPALAIAGFRTYEITGSDGAVTMLLSKSARFEQQGCISCHYLGDDVAFDLRGTR